MAATFWSFIEGALDFLRDRKAVSGRTYARLAQTDKLKIIGSSTISSARGASQLKQLILDSVREGEDEAQFRKRIADHIELRKSDANRILRTSTKQAYLGGMTETLEKPHVTQAFPYVMYVATHDGRTRDEHREMDGKIAKVGSAEYDHFVELQSEWHCRCSLIPLSAKQAQARGVDVPEAELTAA